jgi:ATP synthase protein I
MPLVGPEVSKQLKQVGRLSAAGIEIAISTVIGLLGGSWLDGKLKTAPYLAVLGLLIGTVAGFRSVYMAARKAMQHGQSEHKSE